MQKGNDMKEVTEWNNKPCYMWCWDNYEERKTKDYVLYILTDKEKKEACADYSVVTVSSRFLHCAEIEEEPKRPCTRDELVEMLKKQGLPMLLRKGTGHLYTVIYLDEDKVEMKYGVDYAGLCEQFTLLDGSELWVKE